MPAKGWRSVSVREETYARLRELMEKYGIKSISDVIDALASGGINHPLSAADCRARKVEGIYYLECRDGGKAFVPEDRLKEFVRRFGDVVEVVE